MPSVIARVLDDGTTSCTQHREVHYIDADGARQRIELAREAGLGGVALWALGYDDAGTWQVLAPVVRPSATGSTSLTSTVSGG